MGFGGAEDLGNFRQGCGVNFQKPMCVFVVFGRGFVQFDHARSEPKRTLIHERLDFIGQFKPPSQSLDWQGAVFPTGGAFVATSGSLWLCSSALLMRSNSSRLGYAYDPAHARPVTP